MELSVCRLVLYYSSDESKEAMRDESAPFANEKATTPKIIAIAQINLSAPLKLGTSP